MEVTGQSYAPVALSPRPSGGRGMLGEERNVLSVPRIEHWLPPRHPARRMIVTVTEICSIM